MSQADRRFRTVGALRRWRQQLHSFDALSEKLWTEEQMKEIGERDAHLLVTREAACRRCLCEQVSLRAATGILRDAHGKRDVGQGQMHLGQD